MQVQARKLIRCVMMLLSSSPQVAWVGPEQPLPLWLWVQEGDFISPELKVQGSSIFRDHLHGESDRTPIFSPVTIMCWLAGHRLSGRETTWERELLRNRAWGKEFVSGHELRSRRNHPHTRRDLWPGGEGLCRRNIVCYFMQECDAPLVVAAPFWGDHPTALRQWDIL